MNCSKTNELLTSVKNELSETNKSKIRFNARLTDDTNEYLEKANYFY